MLTALERLKSQLNYRIEIAQSEQLTLEEIDTLITSLNEKISKVEPRLGINLVVALKIARDERATLQAQINTLYSLRAEIVALPELEANVIAISTALELIKAVLNDSNEDRFALNFQNLLDFLSSAPQFLVELIQPNLESTAEVQTFPSQVSPQDRVRVITNEFLERIDTENPLTVLDLAEILGFQVTDGKISNSHRSLISLTIRGVEDNLASLGYRLIQQRNKGENGRVRYYVQKNDVEHPNPTGNNGELYESRQKALNLLLDHYDDQTDFDWTQLQSLLGPTQQRIRASRPLTPQQASVAIMNALNRLMNRGNRNQILPNTSEMVLYQRIKSLPIEPKLLITHFFQWINRVGKLSQQAFPVLADNKSQGDLSVDEDQVIRLNEKSFQIFDYLSPKPLLAFIYSLQYYELELNHLFETFSYPLPKSSCDETLKILEILGFVNVDGETRTQRLKSISEIQKFISHQDFLTTYYDLLAHDHETEHLADILLWCYMVNQQSIKFRSIDGVTSTISGLDFICKLITDTRIARNLNTHVVSLPTIEENPYTQDD